MTERWTEVQGRAVRWLEAGDPLEDRAPLVIVPGLGLSADFYRRNLEPLSTGGHVIALDPPGFGRSDRISATGLSMPAAAEWLNAFATSIDLPAAIWIGHSVSCQALIELAAHRPQRVRALVLAAPAGAGPRWWRAPGQIVALAAAAFVEPPALLLALSRDYLRANPLRYVGTWLRAAGHPTVQVARRVDSPVLLVGGARDPVARLRHLQRLATALPNVRTERLPSGAHGLPFDDAEAFNGLVRGFVDSLPPRIGDISRHA